jgi:transposase InsO family protein
VPARPNAVWQADITYVETDEGWLYVAGILDRCTRRCVGWAMSDSWHTALPRHFASRLDDGQRHDAKRHERIVK